MHKMTIWREDQLEAKKLNKMETFVAGKKCWEFLEREEDSDSVEPSVQNIENSRSSFESELVQLSRMNGVESLSPSPRNNQIEAKAKVIRGPLRVKKLRIED